MAKCKNDATYYRFRYICNVVWHKSLPQENERDLGEIPKNIKQNLTIKPVRWIDEVLEIALTEMPKPLSSKKIEPEGEVKEVKKGGSESQKRTRLTKH